MATSSGISKTGLTVFIKRTSSREYLSTSWRWSVLLRDVLLLIWIFLKRVSCCPLRERMWTLYLCQRCLRGFLTEQLCTSDTAMIRKPKGKTQQHNLRNGKHAARRDECTWGERDSSTIWLHHRAAAAPPDKSPAYTCMLSENDLQSVHRYRRGRTQEAIYVIHY